MASQHLPPDVGFVFVISCDEERVADALNKRRAHAELAASTAWTEMIVARSANRVFPITAKSGYCRVGRESVSGEMSVKI